MSTDAAVRSAEAYLRTADRLLPGRITGFYVVGSTALGAFTDGRSDVDFLAVVDGPLDDGDLRCVRRVHLRSSVRTALGSLRRGHSPLSGTCNGEYYDAAHLTRPVSEIVPLVLQIGETLRLPRPDETCNPVDWKVFAEHGIPVRGPQPSELGLDPEPGTLAAWNLGNLDSYWQGWADRVERAPMSWFVARPSYSTAWGMLGPPRLHCTIATGEVVSKVAAGEYALATFDERWHPLLRDAIAYRRGEPRPKLGLSRRERARQVVAFVHEVIESAHALEAAGPPPS